MANDLYQKTGDRSGANEANLPGDHYVLGTRVDHRMSLLIPCPTQLTGARAMTHLRMKQPWATG